MDLPAAVRDRDVVQDKEGRLFITLGYIQPSDRIVSLLKYVPSRTGKWRANQTRYDRVFWGGVASAVEGEGQIPAEYLYDDPHFGVPLIAPPREVISQYYQPEARLGEILQEGPKDILEKRAQHLAEALHDHLGISLGSIGVAGSILWKGHNPQFSDINMNIYGKENAELWRNNYARVSEDDSKLTLRALEDWANAMARIRSRIPFLSATDLECLFSRRHAICVDNQCIGITPVLYPEEAPISYGSERYTTLQTQPVRIEATISGSDLSYYHPAIYDLEPVKLEAFNDITVDRLMVYDGAFGGLFVDRDRIEVSGTLQGIVRENQVMSHQLMIGTKAGAGREYIRILA